MQCLSVHPNCLLLTVKQPNNKHNPVIISYCPSTIYMCVLFLCQKIGKQYTDSITWDQSKEEFQTILLNVVYKGPHMH